MGLTMASRQPPSQQQPPTSVYSPRRSTRVDENAIELTPDGDTWQEKICVCEGLGGKDGKTPRLILKSYYRNNRTLQKVWDEPPTGASTVRYASSQDRRKAEAQLKELQSTLNMIPAESALSPPSPKKERSGVGSIFGAFRRNKHKPAAVEAHDSQDVNLQKAIARSMADHRRPQDTSTSGSSAGSLESPRVHYDPERRAESLPRSRTNPFEEQDDDEEAALVEALSLSLSESHNTSSLAASQAQPHETPSLSELSEDELLQLAIMESQRMAERSQGGSSLKRDSPRRSSRHRHELRCESSYESPRRMSDALELLQDDVESGNRKPAARKSARHSNSRHGVTDDHQQQPRTHSHQSRKVTRARDPPADPPSQFMEEDYDEDVDFDNLYNKVDDEGVWDMQRAPAHQRASLFGRAPSGRKGY
jgi:hypothetical protein